MDDYIIHGAGTTFGRDIYYYCSDSTIQQRFDIVQVMILYQLYHIEILLLLLYLQHKKK